VSRKAKISVKSETAKLDSLKTGQKVKISYHNGLEIVLKIEAMSQSITLFNGADLSGWSQMTYRNSKSRNNRTWIVDAKRKVLVSLGGDFHDLRTDAKFKNFSLTLEWRFTPGKRVSPNGSGIVVRSNGLNTTGHDPRGIEIDFRPKKIVTKKIGTGMFIAYSMPIKNYLGETDGEQQRILGWLREPTLKPAGEWNDCEIVCKDDRITVTMNGELVNEGWGVQEEAGHICLRNQNTAVEFRNIRLVPMHPSKANN
jgi:hypothetical protein